MTIGKVVDCPLLISVNNGVVMSEDTEFINECTIIGNGAAVHWIDLVKTDDRNNEGSHMERQAVDGLCKKDNLSV